jgi:ankyrin repeat protein
MPRSSSTFRYASEAATCWLAVITAIIFATGCERPHTGISVVTQPSQTDTHLIWAIVDNKPDIALSLIRGGADPNMVDDVHKSPALYYAVSSPHCMIAVVRALVERGAKVNKPGRAGEMPLHGACFSGCAEVVVYLISRGADVTSRTDSGDTPLHIAAGSGLHLQDDDEQIINALLAHGADANATDVKGQTPLDLAHEEGLTTLEGLLKDRGAKSGKQIAAAGKRG